MARSAHNIKMAHFIEGNYGLSLNQERLLEIAVKNIHFNKKQQSSEIQITESMWNQNYPNLSNDIYATLVEVSSSLYEKSLDVRDGKEAVKMRLISGISKDDNDRKIGLMLSDSFIDYVNKSEMQAV